MPLNAEDDTEVFLFVPVVQKTIVPDFLKHVGTPFLFIKSIPVLRPCVRVTKSFTLRRKNLDNARCCSEILFVR